MYSLILMTAVATTGDSSSFFRHRGGCHGCYGSAVVVAHPAPVTYSVGCYGTPTYAVGGWSSCYGCCGGCSGWNMSFYSFPVIAHPLGECACYSAATPTTPAAAASVKLELPADAKLIVDGQPVPGTGAVRSFATPQLPAGKAFAYDMTAEMVVGGVTVREELKVVVHAGDAVEKTFPKLLAAARKEGPTAVAKK